jgi:glycosyltransferase involved in cell wall biosynthesis
VEVLLAALGHLAERGLLPRLTIAGDGPEREPLAAQARALGIAEQIDFLGSRQGEEVVRLLNAHRILVVPSRYDEPFGIVALEGIACGCLVIGSRGGGLKEAIGRCGLTFANGDSRELADLLERLWPTRTASSRPWGGRRPPRAARRRGHGASVLARDRIGGAAVRRTD